MRRVRLTPEERAAIQTPEELEAVKTLKRIFGQRFRLARRATPARARSRRHGRTISAKS
jgi:hypothetical protein